MARKPALLLITVALCAVALGVHAGTLYKSVGPDGRVTYSDQPPAQGKVVKTMDYSNLPASPLPESVLRTREELLKAGRQAPSANTGGVQLFSASWCGYCRKAKAHLDRAGIAYREIDIDTPDGAAAFAGVARASGIPLLVWGGRQIKGYAPQAYDEAIAQMK